MVCEVCVGGVEICLCVMVGWLDGSPCVVATRPRVSNTWVF